MEQIQVTLRVITPIFTGGATDPETNRIRGELRPSTIKGLLRFWYRALHPTQSYHDADLDRLSATDSG